MVVATHGGMTTDEFERTAKEWFATARHPRFQPPYTDLAFQPMVELLGYPRAKSWVWPQRPCRSMKPPYDTKQRRRGWR